MNFLAIIKWQFQINLLKLTTSPAFSHFVNFDVIEPLLLNWLSSIIFIDQGHVNNK